MKSIFTTMVVLFSIITIFAQTPAQIMDEKSQTMILVGQIDPKLLTEGEFGVSYAAEFVNYTVEPTLLNQLNQILQKDSQIELTIVLGTWCGDSKEQVPRFFKINSLLKTPFSNLNVICVDRNKKGGISDVSTLNIAKVPTFIFFRNGIEIGRIIETPLKSLESDIVRILSTK